MTELKTQLVCIECQQTFPWQQVLYSCGCGGLLELRHSHLSSLRTSLFDERLSSRKPLDRSGVWRFREAVVPFAESVIVTHPEGGTHLYERTSLNLFAGMDRLQFKHEGENPSGSFKDRGMTAAISQAVNLNQKAVACASTGNTSAALASYAAQAGLKALVFLPDGKVATGKIAQALGYGATCLAIAGDFDEAMELVRKVSELGVYLVNSVNPFRLEGQKTIIWEMLQDRSWNPPDWIVVPGGNLGNTSAFGKAIHEAYDAGWIKTKPRIATIQASGANPFSVSYRAGFASFKASQAETLATAINIGNPVNYHKARRVITELNGVVLDITDSEIMDAKRAIDASGLGCEPASAATLAGVRTLRLQGIMKSKDDVVCVLTGHMLKDADAIVRDSHNRVVKVEGTVEAVRRYL